MRVGLALAALALAAACHDAPTAPTASVRVDLSRGWVRASPGEVGMSAPGLLGAAGDASGIPRFRSLLVARHGRLVAEYYFGGTDSTTLFDVRSVTKSVVCALTGIALRDGVLPGTAASIAPYLAAVDTLDSTDSAVTVRDLLTMTSGYAWDETNGPDYNSWIVADNHVQYLLDRVHAAPPGATFTYNSAAVHTLGVVLEDAAAYFAWGYGGQFVYIVPDRDLVVLATTDWVQLTEITPAELAAQVLGVIVNDVVPAAR